jgi:hypothetical protein
MQKVSDLALDHIPVKDARPIGLVVMGSHMWKNDTPESDVDAWAVVQEPTTRILRREGRYQDQSVFRSETEHKSPVDIHVHEIGRMVDQLLLGNINFVTGTLSPVVVHTTPAFASLRAITRDNPSKALYGSVHGMAIQNFARYAGINRKSTKDKVLAELQFTPIEPRRCAKMLSFIEFAIYYLEDGVHAFEKPSLFEWTTEGVDAAIKELDAAYANSVLPDHPDPEPFRQWLLRQRMDDFER